MAAVAPSDSHETRSFDGSATWSTDDSDAWYTVSDAGSTASATSSALFSGETIPVRRTKSLSDLRSRKSIPKLHRLQRIPRRSSFDDASRLAPDWPGQLLIGYDEDGIHSCSHCQKITIDLRLIDSMPNIMDSKQAFKKRPAHRVGDLGVTYAEAKRAAEEGCLFFLSLGPDIDPRINTEDIAKGRNRYSELPKAMLHRSITYSLLETRYPYSSSEMSVILKLEECFDDGDYISEDGLIWALYTLDGKKARLLVVSKKIVPKIQSESRLLPQSFRRRQELHMHSKGLHETSRGWMATCNEQHPECWKRRPEFTPLRLLRVSYEGVHDKVTLASPKEPVQYATLSYCWGGDQRFKTTSKTIASAQNGLPLEVLPETIQDAIRVTRDLGVAYLWVDSLCIVQDDEAEMLDQISQMAHIFEGSCITIAASQSPRSSYGFLSMSNPFGLVCKVAVTRADGSKDFAGIGKCSDHPLEQMPLTTRAWTLQETLLSPRIISFEYGHLHWYCPTLIFRLNSCMIRRHTDLRLGFDTGFTLTQSWNMFRAESDAGWQGLVEMYSRRQLTYDADKLLAISAVAERFARLRNWGRYMAGIWEEDLLLQCTWTVDPRSTRRSSVRVSHVPSWSWASVSAEIHWYTGNGLFRKGLKPSCCILSAEVELKSEKAPFGDVVGGRLVLKGRLKRALCELWNAGGEATLSELLVENPLTGGLFLGLFLMDLLKDKSGCMIMSCLEVAPLHVTDSRLGKQYSAFALVLAYDKRTDTYQRVGCLVETRAIANLDIETERALQAWWSKGWKTRTVTIV